MTAAVAGPLLQLVPHGGAQPLSPDQETFNALVQRIEAQRALLAAWEAAEPLYLRHRAAELQPQLDALQAQQAATVRFLDQAHDWKGLDKGDRRELRALLCGLALSLVQRGTEAAAMQALHDQYCEAGAPTRAPRSASADAGAAPEPAVDSTAGATDETLSPEEQLQRLHDDFEAAQARAAAQREQRRHTRHATRGKAARQAREADDARQAATQSLREVYRKLASALHPDREPDAAERVRKTALMQRVNQAYADNRLLDLLQLQLEAELVDAARIAALGDARLKHYNRVLAEQLAALERQNRDTEQGFRRELGLGPRDKLTPATLPAQVRRLAQQLRQHVHALQLELRSLSDARALRRWLQEQQAWRRDGEMSDDADL